MYELCRMMDTLSHRLRVRMLPHSLLTRRPCLDIGLFQLVDIGRENFLLEVATRLPRSRAGNQ